MTDLKLILLVAALLFAAGGYPFLAFICLLGVI